MINCASFIRRLSRKERNNTTTSGCSVLAKAENTIHFKVKKFDVVPRTKIVAINDRSNEKKKLFCIRTDIVKYTFSTYGHVRDRGCDWRYDNQIMATGQLSATVPRRRVLLPRGEHTVFAEGHGQHSRRPHLNYNNNIDF